MTSALENSDTVALILSPRLHLQIRTQTPFPTSGQLEVSTCLPPNHLKPIGQIIGVQVIPTNLKISASVTDTVYSNRHAIPLAIFVVVVVVAAIPEDDSLGEYRDCFCVDTAGGIAGALDLNLVGVWNR